MSELRLGVMSNKELAAWFGLKEKSFKNKKAKKLEELRRYADFNEVNGKIEVTRIYERKYDKSNSYESVRDKVEEVWRENGIDTCQRIASQIVSENDIGMAEGTVYNLARKARNELYGNPSLGAVIGSKGSCVYVWCKKYGDGANATYDFLSEEEKEIKRQIADKYFKNVEDKTYIVKAMVASGQLSKDEAWDYFEEMADMDTGKFKMFLDELQATLKCTIVKGTYREKGLEFLE